MAYIIDMKGVGRKSWQHFIGFYGLFPSKEQAEKKVRSLKRRDIREHEDKDYRYKIKKVI